MLRLIAVMALAGGAALVVRPAPAAAETVYPWCALYTGGYEGSGATNCGFVTHKQCWDTVAQGRIGDCFQNPAYDDVAARPRPYKKRH